MFELYNDDCFAVMPKMDLSSVDLVCTDPPYGVSHNQSDIHLKNRRSHIVQNFGEWDVFPDEASFELFTSTWLKAIYRVLKPGKILCFFFSLKKLGLAERLIKESGFILKDYFFKICTNPMPNIRKIGYQNAVEPVLICKKGGESTGAPFRKDLPSRPNYIRVPVVGGSQRSKHPTQKHKGAIAPLIQYWSIEGDVVFDPFSGSGTTGVVAHELGRRYIGIEANEEYFKIGKQRLAAATSQLGLFLNE